MEAPFHILGRLAPLHYYLKFGPRRLRREGTDSTLRDRVMQVSTNASVTLPAQELRDPGPKDIVRVPSPQSVVRSPQFVFYTD